MAQLQHDHLAQLIGISLADGPKIFTRLRKLGSLNKFLINQQNSLKPLNLMRYILQITSVSFLNNSDF